ncbi:type I restriction enzyme R subunit [Methylomonas methanica]|uniref:Type I restriction enzyme endonuclease subunit n=3 Tax=Methylococcaceae TaxID=403 RepID=A0A126T1I4_9GAMM|nr:type I restriction endonuclease subunit R [Methylomonas methanica]AMK75937.1 restriction endonuclease subunit R [Methylomonas denitrificans]OAI02062.1 restriction endonuclease subunit R [Methylomonas methanica]TCV84046.1 type I restriction enzyme R subunit [Methylomonas methanica]
MAAHEYLEDLSSLLPAVGLLSQLGYRYLTPSENLALRGGRTSKLILENVLREQLQKFNSITFKGQQYAFSDSNIQKAVQALTDIPFDSLMNTSEQVYDLLTLGKSLEQTIDGYTKSFSLHYIDWKQPQNNVYHVCDEFVLERRNSKQTRRPDMVLFVNGIPLAVIECKRPDHKGAAEEGISQHLRNQRTDEIPELFTYAQILLSVSQNQALYGTTGTPAKFWAIWKEEDHSTQEKYLHELVNQPLDTDFKTRLFAERDEYQQSCMETAWQAGQRLPSPQDKAIHSLLRPERLLELIYQYIVFDNKEKKICRYQQYFAVGATLARVTQRKGDTQRPGGVIWHTTGSGKSLTMVMLAKALVLAPDIHNPKIVLVTDRIDLDDQIYKTFHACGKPVVQAKTGEHLLELIAHNKASIITTIIDKFESASRKRKISDPSSNIFVLVDESHRSQYGVSHAKMQNVFPNACYIGFTGTPLLKKEKTTAAKFGGFIHKYTMNQAVADGAVTPLLYEGRMSELHGDKAQIDKWFERITKDLTAEQKADLKKKFRREEELSKSEQRLAEIAYDIGQHFKDNYRGTGKKGQFAVSSKAMALRYKKYFDEFGDVSTEVMISPPDTREGNKSVDEDTLEDVQVFWKAMMAKYGSDEKYQTSIINAFKYSDEPEILIVVDKLLTGFDAPRNSVLYLDKRLKEHNILQAIARVNRLFEGKDYGLIIDYRGIFGELNEAIDTYAALENEGFDAEDIEGTLTDISEEIKLLPQRHTNVWEVFKEVGNHSDLEAMQRHLEPEDRRQRFYEVLSLFAKTLQLALANAKFQDETPKNKIARYKDDLKSFLNLRQAVKQRYGEAVDYSSYETQIRNMVNKYIGADAVKQLIAPVNVFAIDEFEREIESIEGDAAKADAIASRVKKTITEKMEEDPALYKRLSELIDEAIAEHRAKRLSDVEYLKRVRETLDELRGKTGSDLPDILAQRDEAKAYYGVIQEPMAAYSVPGITPEVFAAETAVKLDEIIREHKIRDWTRNQDIKNLMMNEIEDYLYSLKGRYDLAMDLELIERITNQVLAIAERRDH